MKIHLWQKAGARLMESGTICVPTVLWQKTTGKKARMEFGTDLGADGVMMTNATTPDGYRVGADGAWIR